ncbi:hypothetical protein [Parashewanella tropica]|uniref:hypothetical protein n=1 Tax=Parashewanella tropica TaxID=2547970 RepID=UPI0010594183|nr:hypothetical protein [Parashewanella tropica]
MSLYAEPSLQSPPAVDFPQKNDAVEYCKSGHALGQMSDCMKPVIMTQPPKDLFERKEFTNEIIYDLTKIPLQQLILKSVGTQVIPDFHKVRDAFHEEQLKECFRHQNGEASPLSKAYQKYFLKGSRIEAIFKTFFNVGFELVNQMEGEPKQRLLQKHSDCPMVSFHDSRHCAYASSYNVNVPESIRRQQMLTVPDFDMWLSGPSIHKGRLLDKILVNQLKQHGLRHASLVTFRGYIHSNYGNRVAETAMFNDACDVPLLVHGPRTHAFQIINFLSSGLTPDDLSLVIRNDKFNQFFDRRSDRQMTYWDYDAFWQRCYYHGFFCRLSTFSPEAVNGLLLQKQLSTAIGEVINCGTSDQKFELLSLFGLTNDQASGDVNKDLRLVELVIKILEAYSIHSLYKAFAKAGYRQLPFHCPEAFIPIFSNPVRRCDLAKIRTQLIRGYKVAVIFVKEGKAKPEHTIVNSLGAFDVLYPQLVLSSSWGYITEKPNLKDETYGLKAILDSVAVQ